MKKNTFQLVIFLLLISVTTLSFSQGTFTANSTPDGLEVTMDNITANTVSIDRNLFNTATTYTLSTGVWTGTDVFGVSGAGTATLTLNTSFISIITINDTNNDNPDIDFLNGISITNIEFNLNDVGSITTSAIFNSIVVGNVNWSATDINLGISLFINCGVHNIEATGDITLSRVNANNSSQGNGCATLSINTPANTILNGIIQGFGGVGMLTIGGGGTTIMNSTRDFPAQSNIVTLFDMNFADGENIIINEDISLFSLGGGPITVSGTIDGANELSLRGNALLQGDIGVNTPLSNIETIGNTRITTFEGEDLITTGDQNFESHVILTNNQPVLLQSQTGNITFQQPLTTAENTNVVGAMINIQGNLVLNANNTGITTFTGNTSFQNGRSVEYHINDVITPGTDYDQLQVNGTIDLANATLNLVNGLSGNLPNGTSIMLVTNDGVNPIIGNFNGLPENAVVSFNNQDWNISYTGGDGNDITLTIPLNQPPVAVCQDITVQLDNNGIVTIQPNDVDGGSTDPDGDTVSFSIDMDSFDCSDIGSNTVTLTVNDGNGETDTCTAIVTIEDNTPPVISCPSDITIECDEDSSPANTGTATATDNCDANPSIAFTDVVVTGVGSNSTITRTWTATDVNGNSSSCDQIIEVVDTTAPTPVCMDITVSLDENGMYVLDPSEVDGGSTDNCDPNPELFVFPSTFTCDDIGTNNVTLTITDANGNANVCGAIVTVVDDTPPVISCPADITASADAGMCDVVVNFPDAIALDNCNVTVTQTNGPLSGGTFPVGTTVVEFTATDAGGNSTSCTFNVTVTDDELPAAVCQDITIDLDEFGTASIIASDIDGGSTDNCAIDTLSIDIDTFDCSNVGSNNVVLTVTDVNGNVDTCTAVVTVEDTTAPLAVCQDITIELDANGMASIVASDVDGGSSDACGIDTLTVDVDTFDCSNIGANNVVLTVTDINGNTSTCTAVVTVVDTIAPTLVCQPATITIGSDGTFTEDPLLLIDQTNPLDNCTIDSLATNAGTLDCSDVGSTITVTVFAVDVNGNIASCETTLTIEDSLGPVFDQGTLPEDTTRDPEANGIYTLEDFTVGVAASDNCSEPLLPIVIAQDPAPGTPLGVGVYDITLTAVDDLGNQSEYVFELTVNPILGVEDTSFSSLSLYPNPASDRVTLSNPNNLDLQEVVIYDLMGRLVTTINLIDMGTEKTIDVSLLQSATYMILIKGKQGITTKQLIIE